MALNAKMKQRPERQTEEYDDSECQTEDVALNAKRKKDMTTLNIELNKGWWLWPPNWRYGFEHQNENAALNAKRKMNSDSKHQTKEVMTLDVKMKIRL